MGCTSSSQSELESTPVKPIIEVLEETNQSALTISDSSAPTSPREENDNGTKETDVSGVISLKPWDSSTKITYKDNNSNNNNDSMEERSGRQVAKAKDTLSIKDDRPDMVKSSSKKGNTRSISNPRPTKKSLSMSASSSKSGSPRDGKKSKSLRSTSDSEEEKKFTRHCTHGTEEFAGLPRALLHSAAAPRYYVKVKKSAPTETSLEEKLEEKKVAE